MKKTRYLIFYLIIVVLIILLMYISFNYQTIYEKSEGSFEISYSRFVSHLFIFGDNSDNNYADDQHPYNLKKSGNMSSLHNKPHCDTVTKDHKFDCHPEKWVNQSKCESRGCCWMHGSVAIGHTPLQEPVCFYPSNFPAYKVTNTAKTDLGYKMHLERKTRTYYPKDIMNLHMDIKYETNTRLHIKIYDPNHARYEVPLKTPSVESKASHPTYSIQVQEYPFSFKVTRTSTKTSIMDTGVGAFIFADQFIQLSSKLPSSYISGLGEHREGLMIDTNWTQFSFWNKDQPPTEGINEYGSHPFYMCLEDNGISHGVFLLNSNAMDVVLQPGAPNPSLTFRTIGGILDLYVFLGPTPSDVIRQYTAVIGRSFMPPLWSLGFHLSRWGIKTANATLSLVEKLEKAKIPLDVQWYDIDYTEKRSDFTWDEQTYGNLPETVKTLKRKGISNVLIVDPGISNTWPAGKYLPYDRGIADDVFIKDYTGHNNLIGKVWPGTVVFPDFTNTRTTQYWQDMITTFHKKVPFDGLWIDMNEPSNFVAGSIHGCPSNNLEDPPYTPGVRGGSLRFNTICASAQQNMSTHYNLHNVYGFLESIVTHKAVQLCHRSELPFVLSRSTYSGSGAYTAHWTGDNNATFHDMASSISAILRMNMFGISMVGSDICGFKGNTTEELCQRWYQLGAFYPFCRTHNEIYNRAQDPTAFGPKMATNVRKVLETRYSLLTYFYYLFVKSSLYGDMVVRPLFFEYPADKNTYHINYQFLWGKCLLVSPVVTKGAREVTAYFPSGMWYDFYSGRQLKSKGEKIILNAPMDTINLHIREGCILPIENWTTKYRVGVRGHHLNYTVVVALNGTGEGSGVIYIDDGLTPGNYIDGLYKLVDILVGNKVMVFTERKNGWKGTAILNAINVLGVQTSPTAVFVKGRRTQFTYSSQTLVLKINMPNNVFIGNLEISWT